jgi:hypothetical protein
MRQRPHFFMTKSGRAAAGIAIASCPCMKSAQTPALVLTAASCAMLLSGCAAIGDIFKAGVGVGIFMVVAVLALIGGVVFMVTKK